MVADPILPRLVSALLVILALGLVLRRFNQPHVVGYLVAGILMGPHALGVFTDHESFSRMGDLGMVLLVFFVGTEMSLPRLAANWRVAIIGTVVQILVSVTAVLAIGAWADWGVGRIVLVGFVISLSSTAVVVSMLATWGLMDSDLGHDVMGIMIVQDVAIAPMLLVLGYLARAGSATADLVAPVVGVPLVVGFVFWLMRQEHVRLPLGDRLRADHELQVFAAAFLCLSFALATALLHLSTALGAFLAGLLVASSRDTAWVTKSLEPFRVILVALFFISVGLMLDVTFVAANWVVISLLIAGVLVTNTFVNASIVRVFGRTWRHSLFAGALLAQIGEFSFVLAAIGLSGGLISDFGYQLTVATIFGTLVVSPLWVKPFRALAQRA